jgi:hypothetical protein
LITGLIAILSVVALVLTHEPRAIRTHHSPKKQDLEVTLDKDEEIA